MKQWVGLDIGGTKSAVLLATVDKGIHISDKVSFLTHTERGFEDTYACLTDAMIQLRWPTEHKDGHGALPAESAGPGEYPVV